MSAHMNKHMCVVIGVDMQGHGYSEGERCLMTNHEHMMNDFIQLVSSLQHEDKAHELTFDQSEGSFSPQYLPDIRKLPFFIMGSSMGGALCTITAHQLQSQREEYPQFKGAILLAPALSFKTANWLLIETLRYTVGTCTPSSQMPQFLSNLNDNTLTFRTAEGLAYAAADSWGSSPEALGWNQGMRWGTALMFIDFAAALQKIMPEVAYPFLIIHDPLDQVCNIEGGRNLMEQSQTSPDKKKLIEAHGFLHGVLVNETEACCNYALKWMDEMI
eukprot:CAMPEP_0185008248 /NCGR_PEP_ID=MMETSP1098-20130426/89160_1 /TAXON_ID=89044 /ORGANISM="Spumella elongata, Strain CCAP 955/1" /LENGTH=272 /DNA_ID=CAMNT_0027536711 /DNA_START=177 /DNA_END=995 /DNA_ORIENTATION=+